MESGRPELDPVEDFLINRKEGHCEYFASALALLLRSIDIPSRLVNGFKGGDWNDLTQTMNVRQKHAHSWVEAYIGNDEDNRPNWITLDPTPGEQRDLSVAQVGGFAGTFRQFTDLVRYIWVFYIIGYDGERQSRLLYTPMRQMIGWAKEKYFQLWGDGRQRLLAVPLQGHQLVHQCPGLRRILPGRSGPRRDGEPVDPPGPPGAPMAPGTGGGCRLADGRNPVLPAAGPAPLAAGPGPDAGRDPGGIRRRPPGS